jgi:hypothetical protein
VRVAMHNITPLTPFVVADRSDWKLHFDVLSGDFNSAVFSGRFREGRRVGFLLKNGSRCLGEINIRGERRKRGFCGFNRTFSSSTLLLSLQHSLFFQNIHMLRLVSFGFQLALPVFVLFHFFLL